MPQLPGDLGAERMPLELPAAGATLAGKALDILGAYLKAAFTHYAGAAWASLAPKEPIVRKVFTHDPEQYNFSQNDLPALYIFAQKSAKRPEQQAEDWRVHADVVKCFWILPPAKHVTEQSRRAPIIDYLGHLVDEMLYRGRDASYIIAGDPDLTAADEGSVVLRHAGLKKMESTGWDTGQIAITIPGSNERGVYQLLDCTIEIERRLFADYEASELVSSMGLELNVTIDGFLASQAVFTGAFSSAFNSAFEGGGEGPDGFDSAFDSSFGPS